MSASLVGSEMCIRDSLFRKGAEATLSAIARGWQAVGGDRCDNRHALRAPALQRDLTAEDGQARVRRMLREGA
eukprot:13197470-Alexandrium_andersonii.AAC.1